jgi:RNA polymerase sigma-70 factor (ECF subfamily)
MEERDAEEICKEFGISTSNYWVMLHRSKLLMRACLEKTYYGKK